MFDPTEYFQKYTVVSTPISCGFGVSQQICEANPRRICLIISNLGPATDIRINPKNTVLITEGIQLFHTLADNFIVLPYSEVGGLCQQAWWGLGVSAAARVYVVETLYDPEK